MCITTNKSTLKLISNVYLIFVKKNFLQRHLSLNNQPTNKKEGKKEKEKRHHVENQPQAKIQTIQKGVKCKK